MRILQIRYLFLCIKLYCNTFVLVIFQLVQHEKTKKNGGIAILSFNGNYFQFIFNCIKIIMYKVKTILIV
jgi:hypothetical protein